MRLVFAYRQCDDDGGAATRSAVDGNRAVVGLDDETGVV